jgi:NAD(P)-dependent dehydrogenase (short-subunit alcohol dehydrogenase family)
LSHKIRRLLQNQSVYFLTLNLDDFESVQEYEGWASYSGTKLENVMFTRELQNRADAAGLDWFTTVSLHPGLVGTDIWRYSSMGTKTVKNKREEKRAGNGIDSLLQFRTTD